MSRRAYTDEVTPEQYLQGGNDGDLLTVQRFIDQTRARYFSFNLPDSHSYRAALDCRDKDGDSVLIKAAKKGHDHIVTALIAAKADLESKNGGKTALEYAAHHRNLNTVTLLSNALNEKHAVDEGLRKFGEGLGTVSNYLLEKSAEPREFQTQEDLNHFHQTRRTFAMLISKAVTTKHQIGQIYSATKDKPRESPERSEPCSPRFAIFRRKPLSGSHIEGALRSSSSRSHSQLSKTVGSPPLSPRARSLGDVFLSNRNPGAEEAEGSVSENAGFREPGSMLEL